MTVLDSADSHGGRSGVIVEKNTAWWRVKLDGDDEATSIRGKDLRAAATTAPGAPVPAPAPAAAAPPPPPPSPAAAPPPPPPPPPPRRRRPLRRAARRAWPGRAARITSRRRDTVRARARAAGRRAGSAGGAGARRGRGRARRPERAGRRRAAVSRRRAAAAPGLRLVGGNNRRSSRSGSAGRSPGSAEAGDTFEAPRQSVPWRPEDILQMTRGLQEDAPGGRSARTAVVVVSRCASSGACRGVDAAPAGAAPATAAAVRGMAVSLRCTWSLVAVLGSAATSVSLRQGLAHWYGRHRCNSKPLPLVATKVNLHRAGTLPNSFYRFDNYTSPRTARTPPDVLSKRNPPR